MIQDEHVNTLSVGVSAMYKTDISVPISNDYNSTGKISFSGFNVDYSGKNVAYK